MIVKEYVLQFNFSGSYEKVFNLLLVLRFIDAEFYFYPMPDENLSFENLVIFFICLFYIDITQDLYRYILD